MIVRRIAVGTVLAALGCTAALLDTSARADPTPRFTLPEQTVTQVRTVQARDHGHSAAYWHLRNQQARRELKLGVLRQHRLAHTLARETRANRRLRKQLHALQHPRAATTPAGSGGGWATVTASAYSLHDSSTSQGCPGAPPLSDSALSVATFLVGCGQHLDVCYGSRCVRVVREDSGPYANNASIDLNVGVVRALGFASELDWGVRTLRWRRS